MANHDLVVLGDCNPDLLLRGDVVPRFGQVEQVVDEAAFAIGGSGAIVAAAAARLGLRTSLVAVKLGSRGGLVAAGARLARRPALPVTIVETTGAGDSFDAGFLAGVLSGWELERALELGCACGSLSATAAGVETQPTLEQALDAYGASGR